NRGRRALPMADGGHVAALVGLLVPGIVGRCGALRIVGASVRRAPAVITGQTSAVARIRRRAIPAGTTIGVDAARGAHTAVRMIGVAPERIRASADGATPAVIVGETFVDAADVAEATLGSPIRRAGVDAVGVARASDRTGIRLVSDGARRRAVD